MSADAEVAIRALLALSEGDALYADRYLDRARARMGHLCTPEQVLGFRADEGALARLAADLRGATARAEWVRVGVLAREATALRARVAARGDVAQLAGRVYAAAGYPGQAALVLGGVLDEPTAPVERTREKLLAHLRTLVAVDEPWSAFYRARAATLARAAATAPVRAVANVASLQARVLRLAEAGEFAEIERIASAAPAAAPAPDGGRAGGPAVPAVPPEDASLLAKPLPPVCGTRAAALGLVATTLPADEAMAACVAHWCRSGATCPADDGEQDAARDACRRPCPPGMDRTLWETMDLLLTRPFVTSAGSRYVPWFGAERLLVEMVPESSPDDPSPLLTLLELPRRRGLARTTIAAALQHGTAAVCAALELDPLEWVLTCIPFDAYLRLAPRHGWGRQRWWTHFDGYQVGSHGRLRALVGGDVRYGGPDDLCSVGCDYESDHVVLRIALVRRARLALRSPGARGAVLAPGRGGC